jgi:hypothetical protein
VVSVPGGAPSERIKDDGGSKYGFLTHAKGWLDGVDQIILAVDGDNNGINLREDLSLRLGASRCKYLIYPKACKDLNDALVAYGAKGVTETHCTGEDVQDQRLLRDRRAADAARQSRHIATGMVNLDSPLQAALGRLSR